LSFWGPPQTVPEKAIGTEVFANITVKYMRQWFLFWNEKNEISQQLVGKLKDIKYLVTQIPWGYSLVIKEETTFSQGAVPLVLWRATTRVAPAIQ